jgi:hypothetical protein
VEFAILVRVSFAINRIVPIVMPRTSSSADDYTTALIAAKLAGLSRRMNGSARDTFALGIRATFQKSELQRPLK